MTLKAPGYKVIDTESEEGLRELANVYLSKGREVPKWIGYKLEAMGADIDHRHGIDDDPFAYDPDKD